MKTAQHVIAMQTDAYLCGHPEWLEIVKDAQSEAEAFESWHETHFEIVSAITDARNRNDDEMPLFIMHINDTKGTGGFYELAKELTDKFEAKYTGTVWGEDLEYFDELESFIETEIYKASCE